MNLAPRFFFVGLTVFAASTVFSAVIETDICVYGGTSGGIAAAVQAKRMGKSVVIVEPGRYLGGLTTGGLGATDIGNKAAVGGISREFYHRIARHYAKDSSWTFESRADYFTKRGSGQSKASDLGATNATMWTFEPSVADKVFAEMLAEAKVTTHFSRPLAMVRKDGAKIVEITAENGDVFRAKMFIDATYEGDLMALAGVSFHVGREANSVYGETLNGVRSRTPHHQFTVAVDPFVKPGDPASGLLPFIQSGSLDVEGAGDRKIQAYNYRLCFTTNEANRLPAKKPEGMVATSFESLLRAANGRLPVTPPADYSAAKFELLGRYLEALVAAGKKPTLGQFWNPIWMPNHKTDINNNGGFSTDYIGFNWSYADATPAERGRMDREHENYIRGFLTFLATDARVPESMRLDMQKWGPAKDEFRDTEGWPRQLYIREARRLVSDYVMSEKNCRGVEVVDDSVGLAAYNMDSHNIQRIVRNGRVENEGDVQVAPMKPYPISYRSLVPREAECSNLLVPVCLAASHIAYGSIRMEPVFMILGQSAATAAAMAIDDNVSAQKVSYARLGARLIADQQVLAWTNVATARVVASLPRLDGIVIDDEEAFATGDWVVSSSLPNAAGAGYRHDENKNKGQSSLTFSPKIPAAARYEISLIYVPNSNRAGNVPVSVSVNGKILNESSLNQKIGPGKSNLGSYELKADSKLVVRVGNEGTDGYVVVDGIQLKRISKPAEVKN